MVDVSIIVINYNYSSFLKRCLESCFNQSTKFSSEVIFLDDGSTDNSLKIARGFKNLKIRIYTLKNRGIEAASNLGFKKSKGKYVVRVDSDDFICNNFLSETIKHLKNKKISFVYSNYVLVDKKGKNISEKKLPKFDVKEVLKRGDFLATGTIYRKSDLKKVGFYNDENKNTGLENYELILRLILKGFEGKLISKNLFCHTRHSKNLSRIRSKQITNYGMNLFKKYNIGDYKTNRYHPYL